MNQVYGGVEHEIQMDRLARGVDIIVATPGRLIDFIELDIIDLSLIDQLILDEADRMTRYCSEL